MRMITLLIGAGCLVGPLAACTHAPAIYTEPSLTTAGGPSRGVSYSLARGVVPVSAQVATCTNAANKTVYLDEYGVSFEPVALVADAAAQLRYAPLDRSDDTLTIETSNGLLTKAYFAGQDRSADAAAKAVEVYKEAVLAAARLNRVSAPAGLMQTAAKGDCVGPIAWVTLKTFDWDPQGPDSTKVLNQALSGLIGRKAVLQASQATSSSASSAVPVTKCPPKTLCYRPLAGFDLNATINDVPVALKSVMLPVKSELAAVEVRRAPFVKAETQIDFTGGVPTKFYVSKPNSATVVGDTLISSVRMVGSIPGALLDGLTTDSGKEKALIDAQTANLDSQTKLIDARAKLLKAQTDLAKAQKGAPAGEEPASEDPPPH